MQEQQLDVFTALYPYFKFEKGKKIRLVECFAGIGFQAMGLQLAEIPYEVVATSEIDKHAIKSYEAIHGHNPNLGSITDIKGSDLPKDIDILTYSFPCTDLSKAGQQKGLTDTRSGLVYEVFRILDELKEIEDMPKVLIMENVVDLVQKRFINEFNEMCVELEQKGYTNYWKVLNSKHYGIAQNRQRVFMVSILGNYSYDFPQGFELTYKLKDYLEDDVDEKYYLTDSFIATMKKDSGKFNRYERFTQSQHLPPYEKIAFTVTTKSGGRATDNYVVDNENGIIKKSDITNNPVCLNSKVNGKQPSLQNRIYDSNGIATAITTSYHPNYTEKVVDYAIRKLTPIETGRLMGMNDQQIAKQQEVTSRTQMYKQHGNGIVAQVIGFIVGKMYYENEMELRGTILKNSYTFLRPVVASEGTNGDKYE